MGMKEVGAFDAKTKLGQLLDWVEAGEEVVITRRGKVAAKLVPPNSGSIVSARGPLPSAFGRCARASLLAA